MKRLTGVLLGIVLVVGLAGMASAATSASITLKIKCVVTLSVDIDQAEYNFGDVAARTTAISTDTITVSNNSLGRTEDYTINCSTYTADWNLQTSDPANDEEDVFSLKALFKDTQAIDGDYGTKAFLDTGVASQQNMTEADFGTSGYDGDDVPAVTAGDRKIWFRLRTPGITTTEAEQSLSVTITANDASLF